MTSSNPLSELALRSLRNARAGNAVPRDAAAEHDLAQLRAMSATQRLERLGDILLMLETCGLPPVSRSTASGGVFRL